MALLASVFASFAIAFLAPFLYRTLGRFAIWIFVLVPTALLFYFSSHYPAVVLNQQHVTASFAWVPNLNLNLSLNLDSLSLLLLMLVTGMGALVALYSSAYLKSHPRLGEFYSYLFLFMASMIGLVLAGDVILLFIFWELTSLASFLLIGFDHSRSEARVFSLQAFLVTAAGGLCLLAGLTLLGSIGGSYDIQTLLSKRELILAHPAYGAVVTLVLIGAFTKSAQLPFHFWLANAMVAPTPVSAFLHSATMVKAGVYLVARLSPALGGTAVWQGILIPVGILTALFGSMLAFKQINLKKLLAYSTVGSLGMMMILLGIGTEVAIGAAMVYILVHSLYKGSLFMVAGAVDHQTGSRNVLSLSGLFRVMPITALAAAFAALSMAGFPPFFGFMGKELLYFAKVASPDVGWIIYVLSLTSNILTVAVAFMVGVEPFLGSKVVSPKRRPKEASLALLAGPCILSLLGVVIGLMAHTLAQPLLSAAASQVSGHPQEVDLRLWHGFNMVLVFSLVTMFGGLFVFFLRDRIRIWIMELPSLTRLGPERGYHLILKYLTEIAKHQTHWIQSGYLSRYVLLTLAVVPALLGFIFSREALPPLSVFPMQWEMIALLVMIAAAAICATVASSRILAAASLGVIGFSIALFYAFFSAPDLAITQIVVETLSVILVAFLIAKFPQLPLPKFRFSQSLRVLVASLVAVLMFFLTQVGMSEQTQRNAISSFFSENSLIQAQGRNIVNVIIVDFRALDTFGEITVLAIASIGVITLLRWRST